MLQEVRELILTYYSFLYHSETLTVLYLLYQCEILTGQRLLAVTWNKRPGWIHETSLPSVNTIFWFTLLSIWQSFFNFISIYNLESLVTLTTSSNVRQNLVCGEIQIVSLRYVHKVNLVLAKLYVHNTRRTKWLPLSIC